MEKEQLHKQAHSDAIAAGQKLADAEVKLDKAEKLLQEANIRMSNARKFEEVLKERQKKLDRAFVALNKQKALLRSQQFKENDRDILLRENIVNF